jgi:hypothetical protein
VRHGDFEDSRERIWVKRDLRGETAQHIARWDPARVLAESETKREIVALHEPVPVTRDHTGCRVSRHDVDRDHVNPGDGPCATLRLLALAFADHSDYRDEWRPRRGVAW